MADTASVVYVRRGDTLDFKTEEDVAYHQVILFESCIGVTDMAINKGDVGTVHIVGAYKLPAKGEIKLGQRVYWDKATNSVTATVGANITCGIALEAQKADGSLLVRIG